MSNKPKKRNQKIKKLTKEQKLEREVELLRAENAYLKKLRASGINIPSRLRKQSRIIQELRKEFRLAVILEAIKYPKAKYMYWQKRLSESNPDEDVENQIKKIFDENDGNYGYRRIDMVLRMRGYIVNHKKILRIMNKLNITCKKFARKSRKYSSYKG